MFDIKFFILPPPINLMNLMQDFRRDVIRVLSREISKKDAEAVLEKPPERIGADLAFPCFTLAKKRKRNPAEIAHELSEKLKPRGLVREVNFYGPYINFYMDWVKASEILLKGILREKDRYGKESGKRQKILTEFAHPNTHKAFHIGHIRNICLGESLSKILESAGYNVVRTNYQGDIGPHVAKCIWGFLHKYRGKAPSRDMGRWLGLVYRRASKEISKNKKAENQMREINAMLYARDKRIMPVWKRTRKWSLDYFDNIYKDFSTKFNRLYFESEVEAEGIMISKNLVKKNLARVSDGAIIVDLEKNGLGVFVLVTREKTPLYHAKDLALAELQMKEYRPNKIVHVVGSEQTMYFRQLFKLLEIMKWKHYDKESHLRYELVNLGTGKKMKSREGEVILYDDLKEKLLKLARIETKKRNPKLSAKELDKTSFIIGMGALKYAMLNPSPEKIIVFDWNQILNFDGDTGPYLQYSHARAKSILRKAGKGRSLPGQFKPSSLGNDREIALLRQLADFPDAVQRAAKDLRPHYIAGYALDLATKFNEFYQVVPVLKANKVSRPARLALVMATAVVLKNALNLLGIEAPERM